MRKPTPELIAREQELLDECKKYQGQYLASHHPDTSFATQYHTRFVDAVWGLLEVYGESREYKPRDYLLETLTKNQIHSCRGEQFSTTILEYVLDLKSKIRW